MIIRIFYTRVRSPAWIIWSNKLLVKQIKLSMLVVLLLHSSLHTAYAIEYHGPRGWNIFPGLKEVDMSPTGEHGVSRPARLRAFFNHLDILYAMLTSILAAICTLMVYRRRIYSLRRMQKKKQAHMATTAPITNGTNQGPLSLEKTEATEEINTSTNISNSDRPTTPMKQNATNMHSEMNNEAGLFQNSTLAGVSNPDKDDTITILSTPTIAPSTSTFTLTSPDNNQTTEVMSPMTASLCALGRDADLALDFVFPGLGIKTRDEYENLPRAEKIPIMSLALQATQSADFREYKHKVARLGEEANDLRQERNTLNYNKHLHSLMKEQTKELCDLFFATMWLGILVMSLGIAYNVYQQPFTTFGKIRGGCPRWPSGVGGGLSFWWSLYRSAETILCYLNGLRKAIVGLITLAIAPWILYKTGLLRLEQGDTSTSAVRASLGLGLVCGCCGYYAVDGLWGDGCIWVLLWEIWTGAHVWLLSGAKGFIYREIQKNRGFQGESIEWARQKNVIVLVLGVFLPCLMAWLPFVYSVS